MEEPLSYDIAIVGYGMEGTIAALMVANFGFKVVVIERKQKALLKNCKYSRIDDEALAIIEQAGLLSHFEGNLYPLKGTRLRGRKRKMMLKFERTSDTLFAAQNAFDQLSVYERLQREVEANPMIEVMDSTRFANVLQDEQGVEIYVYKEGQPDLLQIKSQFLVFCNGVRSLLPDFLNLERVTYPAPACLLMAELETTEPVQEIGYATLYEEGPTSFTWIAKTAHKHRIELTLDTLPGQSSELEAHIDRVAKKIGLGSYKINQKQTLEPNAYILEDWQDGRLFFAGQAAHGMPAYLGLALSAGIKDLNNLFWKMNWVVKEQLDPYILCTFAQERQTDIERLMGLNDWAQSFVASPIWAMFRYLLPLLPKAWLARKTDVTQEVTDGVISDIASGIGKMLPLPEVVNSKGKAVSLNSLLGQGFTVLCLGEDPIDLLSPKSLTYLNDLGCTFIKVTAKEAKFLTDGRFTQKIWDKQGKLERWLKKHRAKIAIIRPDRIVFDLSSTATEVNSSVAILRHYTGAVLKPLVQLNKQDS